MAKAPTPETTPAKVGYVQVPEILYEPVGEGLDALVAEGLTNVLLEDFSGKQRLVPADASWVITSLTPSPGSWIKPTDQVRLGAEMVVNNERLLSGENQRFSAGESSLFLVNAREVPLIDARIRQVDLEARLRKAFFSLDHEAGTLWRAWR